LRSGPGGRRCAGPEGRGRRGRGLEARLSELLADREEAQGALRDALRAAAALPGEGWSGRIAPGAGEVSPMGPIEAFLVAVLEQLRARAAPSDIGMECGARPAIDLVRASAGLAATAVSANNFSASNDSGDLNVTSSQTNNSYTQADTALGSYEFGTADALSSGVGNSLLAANYGPTTELSNNQTNNAEVSSTATFSGGNSSSDSPSYDASASSSAIGNGATAFACSNCGGVIDIGSTQTNTNTINANSLVDITGSNRNVSATATAVGNSASFYVSKPK
jgi:hypothetical protein